MMAAFTSSNKAVSGAFAINISTSCIGMSIRVACMNWIPANGVEEPAGAANGGLTG